MRDDSAPAEELAALLGYHLPGPRTDDELLAQVAAAWADYEELTEQQFERAVE